MSSIVTLALSIWGAGLSTVLAAVTLLDRRRRRLRNVKVETWVVRRWREDDWKNTVHIQCTNLSERAISLTGWTIEDIAGRLIWGSPYEGREAPALLQPLEVYEWKVKWTDLRGLTPPVRVLVKLSSGEHIDGGTVSWDWDRI
jgi:hypothetical protein